MRGVIVRRLLAMSPRFAVVIAPAVVVAATVPWIASNASSAPTSVAADAGAWADASSLPDAKLPIFDAKKPSDAAPKKDAYPDYDAPKPIPPDPVPLASDVVLTMTVRFNKGAVTIEKVRRDKLAQKMVLPRHFGRFAAELYSGPTLVERIRFDFPLIADDDLAGDTYAKGLDVTVEVRIPESDRPNKMEIWDRATDRRWKFAYPPK
jgi:hypothetical protein